MAITNKVLDTRHEVCYFAAMNTPTQRGQSMKRVRFTYAGQRWLAVATPQGPRFFMKIQGKWSDGYSATEHNNTDLAVAADRAKG